MARKKVTRKKTKRVRKTTVSLTKDIAPVLKKIGIFGYGQAKKHITRENLRKVQASIKSNAEKLKKAERQIREKLRKKPK